MGKNYYRIPSKADLQRRCELLLKNDTTWEFDEDIQVHIGKKSAGRSFLWDFNESVFYSNKKELVDFIRSGRLVDEYGAIYTELERDAFIEKHLTSIVEETVLLYAKIIDGLLVSVYSEFS